MYDDATEKLSKWIKETEQDVKAEAGLQSSLPEKRAQLDRVKVIGNSSHFAMIVNGFLLHGCKPKIYTFSFTQLLNKNVEKQRPSVASLREKAENLTKANPDSKLADDVNQMLRQFDVLAETIQVSSNHVTT